MSRLKWEAISPSFRSCKVFIVELVSDGDVGIIPTVITSFVASD